MAYQELTQYNSPNYTPENQVRAVYGIPRTIEGVTYHWWGDPKHNPQFMNIVNYLCRQNGNTSAHVVGEAGRIAWIVDARHAAWHAGNARGNATTVGYECNPRLSDGDYETMGEFHYDMEKAYGRRLSIYVHKEWSATSCSPIDKGRIRAIADRYHAGNVPKPVKQPVPQAIALKTPKTVVANLDTVRLWDLETNPEYKAVKEFRKGTKIDVVAEIPFNGTVYYQTKWSFGRNKNGINKNDVVDYVEPVPIPKAPEQPKPAPKPSDVLVNNQDLEKRVSALEKAVAMIKEFLAKVFKLFNK